MGVLLDSGVDEERQVNPCLEAALDNAPKDHGGKAPLTTAQVLDPSLLLPLTAEGGHRGYVHYPGSLTTPPCTEAVDWFIMEDPVSVSDHQVHNRGTMQVLCMCT